MQSYVGQVGAVNLTLSQPQDNIEDWQVEQVNTQLRQLADNDAELQALVGAIGTGGVSGPMAVATGLSLGSSYRIARRAGRRLLELKPYTDWSRIARVGAFPPPSPQFGWYMNNSSGMSAMDEHTTNPGQITMVSGSASATRVNPSLFYKLYEAANQTQIWIARLASDGDANDEQAILGVYSDADMANCFLSIGVGYDGGAAGPCVYWEGRVGTSTSGFVTITAGQRNTGVWVAILLNSQGVAAARYCLTAQATPPGWDTWTTVYQRRILDDSSANRRLQQTMRAGIGLTSGNTSQNLTARALYYDDSFARATENLSPLNPTWTAQGFATTSPSIKLIDAWDLGADAPALNQTAIRGILADRVNPYLDQEATVEWSCVKGGAVESATAWNQAASLVVQGNTAGSNQYVHLWARIVSDGYQAGAIDLTGLMLPISA